MKRKLNIDICFYLSLLAVTGLIWFGIPGQSVKAKIFDIEKDFFNNSSLNTPPVDTPKKRALIIGISKYCPPGKESQCGNGQSYWWNLNTDAEVEGLKQVLIDANGQYKFDEVKVLKDDEATYENIVNTFKTFLIDQTKPGDIAYFHYSGHGGQVSDDTEHGPNTIVGDEIDGLDETLIPFDYKPGKRNGEKDHSNDIRDDEIGSLISKLQEKKPGNTTLTFDSCFSGTIQRGGNSLVRGSSWEGKMPVTRGDKKDSPSGLSESNKAQNGGYVLMSATRNDQIANEITDGETNQKMGAFTAALIKALRRAGENTTYRDIFQKVNDDVSRNQSNQNPQLEGQLDQKLMSGIVRNPSPYIAVTIAQNNKDIILKAGKLMGVTAGSEYSIYENGKDTSGQSLVKAFVEKTDELTAKLKITPVPNKDLLEKLKTGRAVETKHSFGDMRLKVTGQENLGGKGAENLKSLDLINPQATSSDFDVRICRGICENELPDAPPTPQGEFVTLQRSAGGGVIARIPNGENQQSQIASLLTGEARWRFFNNLKNSGDHSLSDKVKIRLVPVKITELAEVKLSNGSIAKLAKKTQDITKEVSTTEGGKIELHEGDTLMLEIANLSNRPLYITVIDISGDGKVTPLFPNPIIPVGNSSENKFAPSKFDSDGSPIYQRIPCPFVVGITPPFGAEVFRVIATTDENDFSPLFTQNSLQNIQRGENSRGTREAATPFGQLLVSGMTGQISGGRGGGIFGTENVQDVSLSAPAMTIASVPLEIKPRRQ